MTQGTFTTYVQVALGGATGSVLRFWLGSVIGHKAGAPFWGTLFVNVTGCFLIGLLGNLRENGPGEFDRYFLMVGVMGGLVVGSGIGGLLAQHYGVTAPFWFAFAGSAVFVVVIWRQLRHIAHADEATAPPD